MARVEERVHIHRPTEQVWSILTDWESQADWMSDAQSVTVTSPQRAGVGVTVSVPTDIALGLVVVDQMEITEWVEQRKIAVRHTGAVIKGTGAFEITPTVRPGGREGTLFTWSEEINAPLGFLGEFVARYVVVPYVAFIFRRSLRQLKLLAESQPVTS
jgi:carbon monoxide dehydrogenase subunit G